VNRPTPEVTESDKLQRWEINPRPHEGTMKLQKDLSSRVFEPNLKSLVQEARAGLLVKGNGERLSVGRAETIARQAIEFVAIR
jgi:hypothetical protein